MATATRTHYEVLGLRADATPDEVKGAYRKLAKALHPDMPTGSAALFGVIQEAYEVIGDPRKRSSYDRSLLGDTTAAGKADASNTAGRGATSNDGAAGRSNAGTPDAGRPSGGATFTTGSASAAGGPSRPRSETVAGGFGPFAARPNLVVRGRGASIAWWAFPLVLAVTLGAGLLRYTGLTAALFHAHVGQQMVTGWYYHGVPHLFADGVGATARGTVGVVGLSLVLTAGFYLRKQKAPMARIEKAALLLAVAVLAGAGEFVVLASWTGLGIAALAAACYASWVWLLTQLPAPATTEQWESFPAWVAGLRGHYKILAERKDQLRRQRRTERAARRRQMVDRARRMIHAR